MKKHCDIEDCNGINSGIDPCIQQMVKALNDGGIETVASCCGHGNCIGVISLRDGRELMLAPDHRTARKLEQYFPDIHGEQSRGIDDVVRRFLAWRLPEDFAPDAGVSFDPPEHEAQWPSGTNLLSADQAEKMIRAIAGGDVWEGKAKSDRPDFNGYYFDEPDHRRRMRYLVVHSGDLDVNNAYAFRNEKELQKYLKEGDSREVLAVFKIQDITDA